MTETSHALRDSSLTPPSSTLPPDSAREVPARRRRRPSGEPPPLPHELGASGRNWAWLAAGVLVLWVVIAATGVGGGVDRLDDHVTRGIVSLRSRFATPVARRLEALGSPPMVRALRWVVILGALGFRRVRHAIVFFACVLVTTLITAGAVAAFTRPRPLGVEILGHWSGFSHPSRPVTDVAVVLVAAAYTLFPRGRWRGWAKAVAAVYLALLIAARLYLAVDHPTDAVVGLIIGVAITLVSFRLFVPTDVFPVTYRRGRTAHLDVGGRRGQAVLVALREQLGLDAVALAPFGLDGSSGSTPVRITLGDGTHLFGKLYAKNHLRADRSYKLFRTLLYGRLEDESTFSSVRRLVEYEDYLLRLMHSAGLPTAEPYGFVEITPEREYVLVTEFLEGAREMCEAEVDDAVIDDALSAVRAMWDAGLAHRDIKPANVLVRQSRVLLIDVAFAEVRPSPWRQAVDLANMMLVLALTADPERVYARAVRIFTPEEISEAFAATRGIALTSQLRSHLRQDGRDLVSRFRELAPTNRPVHIQRWSLRRVALTVSVLAAGGAATVATVGVLRGVRLL